MSGEAVRLCSTSANSSLSQLFSTKSKSGQTAHGEPDSERRQSAKRAMAAGIYGAWPIGGRSGMPTRFVFAVTLHSNFALTAHRTSPSQFSQRSHANILRCSLGAWPLMKVGVLVGRAT